MVKSLDTNIVLRFLLQDHPEQSVEVTSMFRKAKPNSFAVADVVIFECVWILQGLSYQFDRQLIADTLDRLMAVDQINCNRAMVEKVLPLYLKYPAISFVDLALKVYAELNNAEPLLTYDKKVLRQLPSTALPGSS